MTELTELEARLGHRFADPALLKRALTHSSANAVESNERLEFLGDRVLGLVIAEDLHKRYPHDAEGALALKLNALVREAACARAAETAGLAEHLILARSEQSSGGRKKAAILAGAIEAVIAALYQDGGLEAARAFIERVWAEQFETISSDMRDAKTMLQEWAQGRAQQAGTPVYALTGRDGPDHAPHFVVEVRVPGQAPVAGEGRSKREAEQDAAKKMLEKVRGE